MANIKFKNFATTTLVGSYGIGDTALTVSNVALFPVVSGGTTWFYCVITDSLTAPTKREVVKVTNVSGSVLTVTRAQDSTSAQTWTTGSFIELRLVNAAIEDIISETITDSRSSTTDYTITADSDANGSGSHVRKIGATTYETLSTTVADFNVAISQPREISVSEYGAVGDYVPSTGVGTDDTAAIQAALDACYTAGGGVVTLENKIYKLGSALTIPYKVVLKGPNSYPAGGYVGGASASWVSGGVNPEAGGSGWAATGRKFRNMDGSLWITFDAGKGDGTGTYAVQQAIGLPNYATRTGAIIVRGELNGVNVFQYSFDNSKEATYTDTGTWNSAWNSGYMSGLAVSITGDDASVRNCFIGGFNQAILAYNVNRPSIDNVYMDCINGIEMSNVYDRGYINRVHSYLFSSFSQSLSSLVRRGTFIYLHDTVDWAAITNCFDYGHKYGYYLINVNECSLTDCAADGSSAEVTGYIGLVIETNTQDVTVSNFRTANKEYGIYIDNDAGNQSVFLGCNILAVDRGYHVITGNVTIVGGKFRGSGVNKIGVNNVTGAGLITAYGITFETTTTEITGDAISYIKNSGAALLNGATSELNITDTTEDSTLLLYSDAAAQFNIETYLPSNSSTKHTLFLNKYGGDVRVGADSLVLPSTTGYGIKVDTATPTFGWRDIIGRVEPKATGAGSPTRAVYAGANLADYAFVLNDVCDFNFHIPHDYVPGSDLYFHVHWSHTDAVSITGNVVFTIYHAYAKGHNQANFPAEKTQTITYATTDLATTPQYRHRVDEVAITAGTATGALFDNDIVEVDGLILVTLKVTGMPTFGGTGKLFIHTCDVHYQSNNMATKNKAPAFYS